MGAESADPLLRLSYHRQRVARPPPMDKYKVTVCQSCCVQPHRRLRWTDLPPHRAGVRAPNDIQLVLNMTEQSLACGDSASTHSPFDALVFIQGRRRGRRHESSIYPFIALYILILRLHVAALCKQFMTDTVTKARSR